jgi:hypothetical protein
VVTGVAETMSPVVILPRTQAGRDLLRLVLPAAHGSDRPDGELPDGSSIYGVDFDELAVECEQDSQAFEQWCRERENGGCK